MRTWWPIFQDGVGDFVWSRDFPIGQILEAFVICFLVEIYINWDKCSPLFSTNNHLDSAMGIV